MKLNRLFLLWLVLSVTQYSFSQTKTTTKYNGIIIEGKLPPGYKENVPELKIIPVNRILTSGNKWQILTGQINDSSYRFSFAGTEAVFVSSLPGKISYAGLHAEPGDHVSVKFKGSEPIYSGKGSSKFNLIYILSKLKDSLENASLFASLSDKSKSLYSLNDYLNWNKYLNIKMKLLLERLDSYKGKISNFSYNLLKGDILERIERDRLDRFNKLGEHREENGKYVNKFGLTNKDMCAIYDSTLEGPGAAWLQYEAPFVDDPYYLYTKTGLDIVKGTGQFLLSGPSDTLLAGRKEVRYVSRYNLAKKKYKGIIREEVLAFMFHYPRGFLYSAGFTPKIEAILADYYKQPGFPEYKQAVRKYVEEKRSKLNRKGAPDFVLTDSSGEPYKKESLLGQIAVVDFWFTGCSGCVQMTPALKKVEEEFRKNHNVKFISVSVDTKKEMWLKSVAQGKYTTGSGFNLYTGGNGREHDIIRNYGIDGYPYLLLFNSFGELVSRYPEYDPRKDAGKTLSELIKKQVVYSYDGPYITHKSKEKDAAITISGLSVEQAAIHDLKVQTDKPGQTFKLSLQPSLNTEPSVFERSEKLIVLSDIEGNFEAFRKILQTNKIIDEEYNWVFGNGHLVFAGDMFDRGMQVTECLWLIYSLEDKAKAAGGYVHFVLGNHEIMNLQGNHKYVQSKYKDNAERMQKKLITLYSEETELGKWLRTKNVVEKIGDLLFLHGGVSRGLNNLSLTIPEINEIARPNYALSTAMASSDLSVSTIFNTETSPFWYRSYYTDNADKKIVLQKIIDSTLEKFNVNHIVTGHTVVADTISVHYGSKVINTDTKHAEGKSEALLIEGDRFYRVNDKGNKILLFIDEKTKK